MNEDKLQQERTNISYECGKNDYYYIEYEYYDSYQDKEIKEVDGKFVHKHTYIEDNQIECKYCHSILKNTIIY